MEIASRRQALWAIAVALAGFVGEACHRRSPSAGRPGDRPDAGPPAIATVPATGRIVDRAGRPVPEARVLAFAQTGDGGDPAGAAGSTEGTADLEGRFRLALRPGPHRFLVEAVGFPPFEQAAVPVPATELILRLEGEGRSIVGRVWGRGDGGDLAVVGARVLLAADDGGPVREATTRAGGEFAFGGLGEGPYALRAISGDDASSTLRGVESGAAAPPVRLTLAPGHRVTGRLVDDGGAGLAGLEVRMEAAPAGPGADPLPTRVQTDGAGAFVAGPVRDGPYRLTAMRPGYLLRRVPRVELTPGAAVPPVLLELVRGARVVGRVRDGHGAAAAGARVRCGASAIDDLTVGVGPLPLAAEAAALPSGAGRALGSTRVAIADREGKFAIDDLIPGRYRLEISHPGAEPFRGDELALAPGERRDLGTLALRAGLAVAGRVVDESGGGVEGARVVVAGQGSGAAAPVALTASTDAGGAFSLALPSGSYRVSATAPGRGAGQSSFELVPGVAAAPLQIRLVRAEATLEGMVRDTGGRPLGRARLAVYLLDGSGTAVASGSADVGGHFTLTGVPAGDLRLEVQHPDYPNAAEPVTSGKYALVTVPFPGAVAGEIRSRASGSPVPRARVQAIGPGGAKASAETRKTGAFQLPRLVPGRWRLTVAAPGFRSSERELDVAASANLGEPSVRDLRLELDPS